MSNSKTFSLISIISIAVMIGVIALLWNKNNGLKRNVQMLRSQRLAMLDSFEYDRETLTGNIATITSERDELKKLYSDNIDSINKLKTLVEEKEEANKVLIARITTISKNSHPVTSDSVRVVYRDTSFDNSGKFDVVEEPVYHTSWDKKWTSGGIVATSDTIMWDIRFSNEFEIWQENQDLDGDILPVVYWKNKNPYTELNDLMSWQVDLTGVKERFNDRFVLAAGVGYGIDNKMSLRPNIGVFFGYKLWGF